MLHEAVGHGLEGDFNRKGTSVFSGKVGEQVAAKALPSLMTAPLQIGADQSPLMMRHRQPPQCVDRRWNFKGYMQDRQNARLMGSMQPATGGASLMHMPRCRA